MAIDIKEWGTFKDSLKEPVFNWFTYPAGFSYKAVKYSIQEEHLSEGSVIYDPFMGSGTTNIVAKTMGMNSIGVEAHPFVYPIAKSKMNWDIDEKCVCDQLRLIQDIVENDKKSEDEIDTIIKNEFPELVLKCYLPRTLYEILLVRNCIDKITDQNEKLFMRVALIATLRDVSIAATGWPYIAPNKIKVTSLSKEGFKTYSNKCNVMLRDLALIKEKSIQRETEHNIVQGDCRYTQNVIADLSVDHIFTSPPYLNNFDYADRTRLEMYVMGDAKTWGGYNFIC